MPEFHLNTIGAVRRPNEAADAISLRSHMTWRDLDTFTQGYIEAMFFTESGDGELNGLGFANLSPDALAAILADCADFQNLDCYKATDATDEIADATPSDHTAGADFWFTRNGHGAGFWDGNWPEPYAAALTDAAHAFGEVTPYLGDDGQIYLS